MNTKANSQRTWLETITTWPAYPVRGQLQWWLDCRTRHTGLIRRTGKGTYQGGTPAAIVYFLTSLVPRDIERRWKMMNCKGCVRKQQWFRSGNITHRIGKTSWVSHLPPAEYKSTVLTLYQILRLFAGISHRVPWLHLSPKLVNSRLRRQTYVL